MSFLTWAVLRLTNELQDARTIMSESPSDLYTKVCAHAREIALLESISALLNWDERTLLPPAAGAYRAEQVTHVSNLIHRRKTDPQFGDWLEQLSESELAADPHSDTGATIRELRREYMKQCKMPERLVAELARASVLGQQAWVTARQNNDYSAFQPHLETTLRLKREQADAIGYEQSPYDVLLDDFEPDATSKQIDAVLEGLREQLVPLVASITSSSRRPNREILRRHFPQAAQEKFGRAAAEKIGFSFERGRLDVTHHPFCSTMGPHDVRITTRYDEQFFPTAFFGILHEAGHGIYEQGLREDQFGLPPGSYLSLGVHESQSRMWENFVGRSRSFWQHFFPAAQQAFPEALGDVKLDDFYFAVNDVQPSLIRVEADEATYNLHIIIRFQLEQALIRGDLAVTDLPEAWNARYREYLGITPPNDADGVLQDIHWSAGLIGYFPTYSLGNLMAAQLFECADRELGGLADAFARGEFEGLLEWLRDKVHRVGRSWNAGELIEQITGEPLSHEALVRHLRNKLAPLYGV